MLFGSREWTKKFPNMWNDFCWAQRWCGLLRFVYCYFIWENVWQKVSFYTSQWKSSMSQWVLCLQYSILTSLLGDRITSDINTATACQYCLFMFIVGVHFFFYRLLFAGVLWMLIGKRSSLDVKQNHMCLGLFFLTCKTSVVWTCIKAFSVFVQSVILSLDLFLLSAIYCQLLLFSFL